MPTDKVPFPIRNTLDLCRLTLKWQRIAAECQRVVVKVIIERAKEVLR